MKSIHFEGENLEYDHENEYFHSCKLVDVPIIPAVGDVVDFEYDGSFSDEKYKNNGIRFIVKKRIIMLSRDDGHRDDSSIILYIDKYIEDQQ